MTELEKKHTLAQVKTWIEQIPQTKRIASNFNSYYLKHLAERQTGAYVTNEECNCLASYPPGAGKGVLRRWTQRS